jgi:bifunctional DNA-binding transcriptional regulator/antitoxin component of YhaV-PrlF toxin-antitoxin module
MFMVKFLYGKNTRKIVKNGRESYYINIPKEIMRELGWKEHQKLTIRRIGKRLVVDDLKK